MKLKEKIKKFTPSRFLLVYQKLKRSYYGIYYFIKYPFTKIPLLIKYEKIRINIVPVFSRIDSIVYSPKIEDLNETWILKYLQKVEPLLTDNFNLLGSGLKNLTDSNNGIKWNYDFKNNYCYPNKYFKSYNVYDPLKNNDIKYPWELSRCQHLPLLAVANKLTKDKIYSSKIISTIEDWIKKNPFQFSVNWVCPMDVSIRIVNWILSYILIKNESSITKKFKIKFAYQVYLHSKHIYENLELWKFRNNHFLADISGLYISSLLFPFFKESPEWNLYAKNNLILEIKHQINDDGGNFESSSTYQRLHFELFFYPIWFLMLITQNYSVEFVKKEFGSDYVSRLEKMLDFCLVLRKPNGKVVQVGDNDDGFFTGFDFKEYLNFDYMIEIGSFMFNNVNVENLLHFSPSNELFWLFSTKHNLFTNRNKKLVKSNYAHSLKEFRDSGFIIYQSKHLFFSFIAAKLGQDENGGHNHNDVLSYELNYKEIDFFIDPGTFCYTSDIKKRDYFRSSISHNTLVVDNTEINNFKEIFSLAPDANPKIIKSHIFNDGFCIEAEHYGYLKLNDPVIVRRMLELNKNILTVQDNIKCKEEHYYQSVLNVAPNIKLKEEKRAITFYYNELAIKLNYTNEYDVKIVDSEYSIGYGVFEKTKKILLTKKQFGCCKITYQIELL